ncbi:unnamed protein product [Rhizoctonia solani]|uniref:Uncharacterized protein n=1 Tax=Rhizoctonia solani TaxID=456999 RepID=A0A8H3D7P0_9AGAM|nr:unnamed protein product [Rhizoctonia solani]
MYDRRFDDRRFASGLPDKHEIDPRTYEREYQYAQCLGSGKIAQTEDEVYDQLEQVPDAPDPWSMSTCWFCSSTLLSRMLSSLQGNYIPIFYDSIKLLEGASSPGPHTTVPDILIEYIPVHAYMDILNQDMRLEDFIAKPNRSEIVVIDLEHFRLRKAGGVNRQGVEECQRPGG